MPSSRWRNRLCYAVAPSFSWRPDDKTDFTFLSNFQNDPDAGYYGWLPREGTVVPYYDANGKAHKLPTDFNEGESDNKISRRQKMVGYSPISSMTLLPCGRTCAMPMCIRSIVRYTATAMSRRAT